MPSHKVASDRRTQDLDSLMVDLQRVINSTPSEEIKTLANIVRELAIEQGHKPIENNARVST